MAAQKPWYYPATGCDNLQHAITQLPYGLIAAAASAVCFLIAGFIVG